MPELTKVQTGFLDPQGPFKLDQGTESAPGIYFDGDENTGFYRSAEDELAVSVAGTQKYKFTSEGLKFNGTSLNGSPYLGKIDKSISDAAIDIFIYDTSKDSDGGTWRKRTSHTSWYNETLNTATRGSRREFPAVAVIVSTLTKVTIYDGDDPDMPMWMVFNADSGGMSGTLMLQYVNQQGYIVRALNGILVIGQKSNGDNYGSPIIRFISEYVNRMDPQTGSEGGVWRGNIADRNSSVGYRASSTETYAISNSVINDLSLTVLPNAPIDPATGLPIPTIAIASGVTGSSSGAISIIKDDGTVINKILGGSAVHQVKWMSPSRLVATAPFYYGIFNNPFTNDATSYISNFASSSYYHGDSDGESWNYPRPVFNLSSSSKVIATDTKTIVASTSNGLNTHQLSENSVTDDNAGIVNHLTKSYNTGWMCGNVKGCFLSDTTASNVVGTEIITNGTFNVDTNGWAASPDYPATTLSLDANRLKVLGGGAQQSFPTVIGKRYVLSYALTVNNPGGIYLGTGPTGLASYSYFSTGAQIYSKTYTYYFTATTTLTYLTLFAWNAGSDYAFYDDVSVRVAEEDRYTTGIFNSGIGVYGTITKTPVATGADLVAYSGFSDGDYLKQPHNSNLEFGTGSFSCTVWFKSSTTDVSNYKGLVYLNRNGSIGEGFQILLSPSNGIYFYVYGPTNDFSGVDHVGYNDGNWHQISVSSTGTVQKVYLDGVLKETGNITTGSITDYSSELFIGKWYGNTVSEYHWRGSIALCRISSTIPSPEQVKKMYEDEKEFFMPNSKCTLYGSSNAVTAIAYDEVTDRLHVGTSSGRSDFQGLRRINNTTTAVTTAISAHDGFIVEQ